MKALYAATVTEEKGTQSNTFPHSIWHLQNIANKLSVTKKQPEQWKFTQSLPPLCNTVKAYNKYGVLNTGYLRNRNEGDLQMLLFRSQNCIQPCGEGNAGCYISSTAYPARLIPAGPAGKESLSLLSAKQLLQSSAKLFPLNTGEVSALGFCTAMGQKEEGGKKKRRKKSTRDCRVYLAHSNCIAENLSLCYQTNSKSRLWSAKWFSILILALGAVGSCRCLVLSRITLCEHTANKQKLSLPLSCGHK